MLQLHKQQQYQYHRMTAKPQGLAISRDASYDDILWPVPAGPWDTSVRVGTAGFSPGTGPARAAADCVRAAAVSQPRRYLGGRLVNGRGDGRGPMGRLPSDPGARSFPRPGPAAQPADGGDGRHESEAAGGQGRTEVKIRVQM